MKRELIAALAACGFAAPVLAAPGNNFIDGYALFSDIDLGPVDDDGIGAGVKGAFQVADRVFLTGEFQTVEYDDFNADFDQIRLGAGFGPGMGEARWSLSPSGDLREAAANLFRLLREADRERPAGIAVAGVPETGLGEAINDRLRRAAGFVG